MKTSTLSNQMKPQFNELTFKSEAELNKWLKKVTFKIIDLEDNGQDMQKIWVHETGEILNSDFNSQIYIGKFIDMKKLSVGNCLNIFEDDKKQSKPYKKLVIENIS